MFQPSMILHDEENFEIDDHVFSRSCKLVLTILYVDLPSNAPFTEVSNTLAEKAYKNFHD